MPTKLSSVDIDISEIGRPSMNLLRALNKAGIAMSDLEGLTSDHPRFLDVLQVLVGVKARALDPAITDADIDALEMVFPNAEEPAPKPSPANRAARRATAKTIKRPATRSR